MTGRKRRVAVLFGGRSAEHEISCVSARAVIDALDPQTTEVVPIGITRDGSWHLLPGPPALPGETGRMTEIVAAAGAAVELAVESGSSELVAADGLETARSTWSSPSCTAHEARTAPCKACWSWPACRTWARASSDPPSGWTRRCRSRCSPRPAWRWSRTRSFASRDGRRIREGVSARIAGLGFPVFTKPATLGSSVGIVEGQRSRRVGGRPQRGVPLRAQGGGGEGARRDPRDRVRGARQRRAGRVRRGRDRPDRSRVLRLRGEVPGRPRRAAVDPGRPEAGCDGAGPADGGDGVPRDRVRGDGARRLLPARRRTSSG